MLYFKGISKGLLPYIRCADIIIYSVSTAFVFHVVSKMGIYIGSKFKYIVHRLNNPYKVIIWLKVKDIVFNWVEILNKYNM